MNVKRKLTTVFAAILLTVGIFSLHPAITSAADCPSTDTAKGQVIEGIDQSGADCDSSGVQNIVSAVVEILSFVVGAAAIIMLIYGGFKYITSAGDSGRVSSAKSTLIYAIVGLIIAVLAQVIVNIVVKQGEVAKNACQYNRSILATDPDCKPPASGSGAAKKGSGIIN